MQSGGCHGVRGALLKTSVLIGAISVAGPLWAQEASAPAAPPPVQAPPADAATPVAPVTPTPVRPVPEQNVGTLEDIIVTAQRREEGLQNVPVAVTAITARDLDVLRTTRYEQLTSIVPNLNIASGPSPNDTTIAIRGIAPPSLQPGQDGSVGFYVDGVFLPSRGASNLDIFDIERIEVLRGPQGTLFGRNSSAGAISVITRAPTDEFRGSTTAEYGEYDTYRVTGSAGGPLPIEDFYFQVGAFASGHDGYQRNTFNGGRLQGEEGYGGRVFLSYDSSGPVRVKFTADYAEEDNNSGTYDFGERTDIVGVDGSGQPILAVTTSDPTDREVSLNSPTFNTREVWGGALTIDADVGGATLTAISAYRSSDLRYVEDADYTSTGNDVSDSVTTSEQWSQEVRLTSDTNEAFGWLAGVYYSHEIIASTAVQTLSFTIPPATSPTAYNASSFYDQQSDSTAAFGQINWRLMEKLTLSLGGRVSNDRITSTSDVIGGIPFILEAGTTLYPDYNENSFTYKATLDYSLGRGSIVYASYATGFRPGGCNGGSVPAGVPACYTSEEAKSSEVGLKLTLLDNRLRFNAAAFFLDYEALQVRDLFVAGGLATLYIYNDNAESYGAEAEITYAPVRGLLFAGSLGVTDASLEDGRKLANAPEVTASGRVEVNRPINEQLEFSASARVSYTGDTLLNINQAPQLERDPYTLVDAEVGVGAPMGRWRVSIWGQNLFDEAYVTSGRDIQANNQTNYILTPGTPRITGLRLAHRF